MKKLEGNHFYVNIRNLNKIVIQEENSNGDIKHAVHAVDTFFSSIEWFGKQKYPNEFVVEKVTGSRLHMYVLANINRSIEVVLDVCQYAFELIQYMHENIYKFKTLSTFEIQVGSAYGDFYDFKFKDDEYEEETTIGYAANYAAKLQNFASVNCICVSTEIYRKMNFDLKVKFFRKENSKIHKYGETSYYEAKISSLIFDKCYIEELEHAKEFATSTYLKEIRFRDAQSKISFKSISKTESKKIYGIPFYADVRGFTEQFEKDDSNLEEMADKTRKILTTMYRVVDNKGTHVQFQGDREFAIFHNLKDYNCITDAIIAGMSLLDQLKHWNVSIGIGQCIGQMYASRIGARGEKDNIVLGETVTKADYYEDEYAGENQIVIDNEIYKSLKLENVLLSKQFKNLNEHCYYTTVGHAEFRELVDYEKMKSDTKKNKYNGAWGNE